MPSTTVLMGAATENGTWAGALAHLGVWDDGRKRYVGAAGYANLELDWFGRDDAFQGQSIGYTNDTLFLYQGIKFRLEDSDFYAGPVYRLIDSDATFDTSALDPGIPAAQFDSRTSGIGAEVSYDSLDHPYGPTRGLKGDIVVTQQGEWLGGDFDYTRIRSYLIGYVPLSEAFVLGARGNADATIGTAPFYDLASIQARGIEMFRYVDDNALYGETELRWDFLPRWTAVAFTGGGAVGGDYGDLGEAHFAGGVGGRYLIAAKYGLRMGLDVAYDGDDWTVYVALGTGWVRP